MARSTPQSGDYLKFIIQHSEQEIKTEKDLEKLKKSNPGLYQITHGEPDVLFQRAWHGSPYDFERFDLGVIGSGDGGQRHGWGLYFASNREVSEDYMAIRDGAHHLYEVEIPDSDVMLDDQKPLSKQPTEVQESLKRLLGMIDEDVLENIAYDFVPNYHARRASLTVNDIYKAIRKMRAGRLYVFLAGGYMSDKKASEMLNKAGIKGITYEGDRDGRCYVVFDDKAISVIEKYNQIHNAKQTMQGSMTRLSNGQHIIELMEAADESTFLHEMGHLFFDDLEDFAELDDGLTNDLAVVNDWADWKPGAEKEYVGTPWAKEFLVRSKAIAEAESRGDTFESLRLKSEWRQERFARGFEMYLEEGKAPTKSLRGIFHKFRNYIQHIYKDFCSKGGRPSPAVKGVMDRMLTRKLQPESLSSPRNPSREWYEQAIEHYTAIGKECFVAPSLQMKSALEQMQSDGLSKEKIDVLAPKVASSLHCGRANIRGAMQYAAR